jgi:hypothetical protein
MKNASCAESATATGVPKGQAATAGRRSSSSAAVRLRYWRFDNSKRHVKPLAGCPTPAAFARAADSTWHA